MTFRSKVRKVHLYLAFVVGLPLAVVGGSGSVIGAADLLYGRDVIAPPRVVRTDAPARSVQELIGVATKAFPSQAVVGVGLPAREDLAYDVALRDGRRVFVDPYSATVVESRYVTGTVRRTAYQVHSTLLAGRVGKTIVGISTLLSMVIAITGLFLWWPSGRWVRGFTLNWRSPWRQFNFELHSKLGFYSSLVLLCLAWTGAVIAYDGLATKWLGGAGKTGGSYRSTAAAGLQRITPAEALRIADVALPGAPARSLGIPQNPQGVYAVFKRFPEEPGPGTSRVFIDQFSGAVLGVKSTREAHAGQRILDLNFPIHTGQIFGVPGQTIALIVSFSLVGQLTTGLLIWWQRNRKRRKTTSVRGVREGIAS